MKYAFDQLLGEWVVLAGVDVVVHTCETEQKAIDYIRIWEQSSLSDLPDQKANLNRGND